MPVFLASLLGGLIQIAGSVAGRVMIALGISVATYTGMSVTLTWLKTQAISSITSLPPEVIGMLSTMKVGQCISIVFSAVVARQVQQGLIGDTLKKWVLK